MYSKVSPKRLLVASILAAAMIGLLVLIVSKTDHFNSLRFLGIGFALLGLGAACLIVSEKDLFFANGTKASLRELIKDLLSTKVAEGFISGSHEGILSSSEAFESDREYLCKLATIRPLSRMAPFLMGIGGMTAFVSIVYIVLHGAY